jgi:glycosyltransferase involved in cell wall biosynthesis
MNILFLHQNFPAQYRHIVRFLAAAGTHRVVTLGDDALAGKLDAPGARLLTYRSPEGASAATHHYLKDFEASVRRGQTTAKAMLQLRESGFIPDVVCVHPGWGEGLFIKEVFPRAKVLAFLEFFYSAVGVDVGFDPEFPSNFDDLFRVRIKNATLLLSMNQMDWGVSPTRWQFERHPPEHIERISVIHDGIDTRTVRPDPETKLVLAQGRITLGARDEVITYVSRNLEPYRGIHTFMRAIPEIHRRRPNAHVVVLGGDQVSYGLPAPKGTCYREIYLREVQDQIDPNRVHFLGRVNYQQYLAILQLSAVHIYLTYPFVLSWSALEAMAAGCAFIGSATPPVEEFVAHEDNGLLVDFFSPVQVADAVDRVLSHPDRMAGMRARARETIVKGYDLEDVCLPKHIQLIEDLAAGRLK